MNQAICDAIFERFAKLNPEPKTELVYQDGFTLLVSIILSAQATDISVNKATKILFAIAATPYKMLEMGIDKLKNYIKTIGLYNAKASNIIKLSQLLIEKYGGKVPDNFEQLCELPGVGRKTANVYLNCYHQHPLIAVDTHVFRVSNRLGLTKAKNVLACEIELDKVISARWKLHAHHFLILHGRYICKARTPLCPKCPVNDLCEYPDKGARQA